MELPGSNKIYPISFQCNQFYLTSYRNYRNPQHRELLEGYAIK